MAASTRPFDNSNNGTKESSNAGWSNSDQGKSDNRQETPKGSLWELRIAHEKARQGAQNLDQGKPDDGQTPPKGSLWALRLASEKAQQESPQPDHGLAPTIGDNGNGLQTPALSSRPRLDSIRVPSPATPGLNNRSPAPSGNKKSSWNIDWAPVLEPMTGPVAPDQLAAQQAITFPPEQGSKSANSKEPRPLKRFQRPVFGARTPRPAPVVWQGYSIADLEPFTGPIAPDQLAAQQAPDFNPEQLPRPKSSLQKLMESQSYNVDSNVDLHPISGPIAPDQLKAQQSSNKLEIPSKRPADEIAEATNKAPRIDSEASVVNANASKSVEEDNAWTPVEDDGYQPDFEAADVTNADAEMDDCLNEANNSKGTDAQPKQEGVTNEEGTLDESIESTGKDDPKVVHVNDDEIIDLDVDDDPDLPEEPISAWKKENPYALNITEKRTRATMSKFELTQHKVRFEDMAKDNGIFGAPMLKVIERYEQLDQDQDEVKNDAYLSDPLRLCGTFRRELDLKPLWLKDWYSILPDDSMDAWFDENTISNMILLHKNEMRADAFCYDPTMLYAWTGSKQGLARIAESIKSLRAKQSVESEDERRNVPGYEVPATTRFIVMPYNVGAHWVTVKIQPDFETRKGKIILYNSMQGPGALSKVARVIPYLAKLIGMHPHLNWNQSEWKVYSGQSTQQRNWVDCGPITASNCLQLLKGEEPIVHTDPIVVDSFGVMLRYQFLQELFAAFDLGDFPRTETDRRGRAPRKRDSNKPDLSSSQKKPAKVTQKPPSKAKAPNSKTAKQTYVAEDFVGNAEIESDDESDADEGTTDSSLNLLEVTKGKIDYRELLCNALLQYGRLTADELLEAVSAQSTELLTLDDERHGELIERIELLLERTDFMFEKVDEDGMESWQLLPGSVGRSVDSSTKERLLAFDTTTVSMEDQRSLQHDWVLALGIVRVSPTVKRLASLVKDYDRCEDLVREYFDKFYGGQMPPKTTKDSSSEIWTLEERQWYAYFREMRSSTTGLFSGGTRQDIEVRDLLSTANNAAAEAGERWPILLIGNGWDALSTDNQSWSKLEQEWPSLDFTLAICVPCSVAPSVIFEEKSGTPQWAHYSVTSILELLDGGVGSPCESEEPQEDMPRTMRYHHERYLYFCQSINAFKLDFSLRGSQPGMDINPHRDNPIAAALTKCHRNRFELTGPDSSRLDPENVCVYCGRAYLHTNSFMKHLDSRHPGRHDSGDPRTIRCLYSSCSQRFGTEDGMMVHIGKVHRNDIGDEDFLQCTVYLCDEQFETIGELDDHLANEHEDDDLSCCEFPGCRRRFVNLDNLKIHLAREHPGFSQANFTCPVKNCNGWSLTQVGITQHINFCHPELDRKRFRCTFPDCARNYGRLDNLRTHVRRDHPGFDEIPDDPEHTIRCGWTDCKRRFPNVNEQVKHIRKEHDKQYKR